MQISESDHYDSDLTENHSDYNTPHHKISRFSILQQLFIVSVPGKKGDRLTRFRQSSFTGAHVLCGTDPSLCCYQ